MSWRPALRPDLQPLRTDGGALEALWDPVLARRINLGRVSRALAERLDGTRTLDALLDEVHGALGDLERRVVEHSLRSLVLMLALDGTGAATLARARDAQTRPLPLVALDDARFACQGSGACCNSYAYGPLSRADVARIEALDLASKFPHLAAPDAEWWDLREDPSLGGPRGFLVSKKGRCTFLLDDERCGLHAHFGVEAKPLFCRIYPLSHRPTIDGWKVFDVGECARFSTSARSGPRFVDDFARIRTLLPAAEDLHVQHPIVMLDDRTPCDFGAVLALERVLCERLAAGAGDTTAAVVAVGDAIRGFAGALAGCALAPEEPERTVAAALAATPVPDEVDRGEALRAVERVARLLYAALAPDVAPIARTMGVLTGDWAREFLGTLHAIQCVARHRLDGAGDDLAADYARAFAVPLPDDADAVWRIALRQRLFADELLVENRLRPGALRLAFAHLAAVVGARLRAHQHGRAVADASDLDAGHLYAARMLRRPVATKLFCDEEVHAWTVFAALPHLL